MNIRLRKIMVVLLLSFSFSQLAHAFHSVDMSEKGKLSSEHLACYICQSHSASAVNTHESSFQWQRFTSIPFQFSLQCSGAQPAIEYQRLLRAPPFIS